MANWNLSVDIRGHGNDLAQSLKSSAKHSRALGTAARTAKTEVKELGQAAETAHAQVAGFTEVPQRFYDRLRASHTGLLDINGSPKPAYFAFQGAVSRLR